MYDFLFKNLNKMNNPNITIILNAVFLIVCFIVITIPLWIGMFEKEFTIKIDDNIDSDIKLIFDVDQTFHFKELLIDNTRMIRMSYKKYFIHISIDKKYYIFTVTINESTIDEMYDDKLIVEIVPYIQYYKIVDRITTLHTTEIQNDIISLKYIIDRLKLE